MPHDVQVVLLVFERDIDFSSALDVLSSSFDISNGLLHFWELDEIVVVVFVCAVSLPLPIIVGHLGSELLVGVAGW